MKKLLVSVFAVIVGLLTLGAAAPAHAGSCSAVSGQPTVCVDPTTGVGPVVNVYGTSGAYITSLPSPVAVCTTGTITPRQFFDNNPGSTTGVGWNNGSNSLNVKTAGSTSCVAGANVATVSYAQWDTLRWYIAAYDIQQARTSS